MKIIFGLFFLLNLFFSDALGQKTKKNKDKLEDGRPKIMAVYGDSVRTDSVVYYQTEIGFVMPDYSTKFKGKWNINVMRRQAKATPDSIPAAYIEFFEDTLFIAYVGCNKLNGYYIIKGPTIKFTITDTLLAPCSNEQENLFIKLIQDRVSYYGIDEQLLYLRDVAFNIVFDCSRKKEE